MQMAKRQKRGADVQQADRRKSRTRDHIIKGDVAEKLYTPAVML